jgi:hypothetical protein
MWLLILATPVVVYGTMCLGIFTVMKLRRDRGISPRCSQTDLRILN